MDIAYYLSELLDQLGEVNVPGLGSFTRVRVDGYYNSDEGRFYPPSGDIEFAREYIDDNVLTQYIGIKKRISLASSKYFTEKYITGLRQEIMTREVPFADLGSLYFVNGQINFRSANTSPDPAFYGYPQITLHKLNSHQTYTRDEDVAVEEPLPEPEHELPVVELATEMFRDEPATQDFTEPYEETVKEPEPDPVQDAPIIVNNEYIAPQPAAEEDEDFVFNTSPEDVVAQEEDNHRSFKWLWIGLLVIAILGAAAYAYLYVQQHQAAPVKKAKSLAPVTLKDTADTGSVAAGTKNMQPIDSSTLIKHIPVQKLPTSTIDSTKRRYEVIAVAVQKLSEANTVIKNYKSRGIDAHVVNGAPGPLLKVSLGTYATKAEATAAINELRKSKKVSKDIWSLPINPKK